MAEHRTDSSIASAPADSWLGLAGTRVLVAGAGGIGGACAAAYAGVGAVVTVVDRDQEALNRLAQSITKGHLTTLEADLTERGAGSAVLDHVLAEQGGLEVFLHAVGINDRRPILEFAEDEWEDIIRVNLTSVFSLAQAAGRHMVERGYGRILALSSVSGLLAHHSHGPYAASKGGVNQLVRAMAREWAPHGVTVNALAPGYIETPLTAAHLAGPGKREELESQVPAGRLGKTSDLTGPALFLSSVHAGFITGHIQYVDGGRTLV